MLLGGTKVLSVTMNCSEVWNQSTNLFFLQPTTCSFFISKLLIQFPSEMTRLKNGRKLTALDRQSQEEHHSNKQSRDPAVFRIHEESFAQVSTVLQKCE